MKIIRYGQDPLPAFINPVLTIGAFDGLHRAHLFIISKLIQSAKEQSGQSIIISFDPHPRMVLDPLDESVKLLTTFEERIQILEDTDLDFFIIVPFDYSFSMMMPQEYVENFLVDKFHPVKIIAGYDHRFGRDGRGDIALLKHYAGLGYFQFEEIEAQMLSQSMISSSNIRSYISSHCMLDANELLGYPYMLRGKVTSGKRLGRTLGYPTANIVIDNKSKLIPPDGVYAAFCMVNEVLQEGMLYIGVSKTVTDENIRLIEINLFDFAKEIYGLEVTVYILDYIREDINFENTDALKRQIAKDEIKIKNAISKYKIHFPPVNKPITAVVILNYNGLSYLQEYLPVVLAHTASEMPVYIIDNNSSDNSCIYLDHHYPEIKQIRLKRNYGFAGGYNRGLAQIEADYFVLLNSDVIIKDDWISPIIQRMQENPSILVAQPKILDLKNPELFEYAGASGGFMDILGYPFCRGRIIDCIEKDGSQYDTPLEIFWASGAAFVVKAAAYKAIRGFDEDYFAHQEEIDLCWRLKRLGGSVMCFPDSKIYHLGGGTLDYNNPRKTYLNFRNNLFTMFKNSHWIHLLIILPVRLALDILIAFSYLLKGEFKVSFKILQAYIISIINSLYLVHKKRHNDVLISNLSFGKINKKGVLRSSIFLQYYFSGNRFYSQIPDHYFTKS